MSSVIFIPPVSLKKIIIDWGNIGFLNLIRAIIFLIGITFLPGSCIYNLLFPNSTLHERFKVEPFLLKIAIYPVISLTFLGTATLIIDIIGVVKRSFSIILFFVILLLLISDLFVQKLRTKTIFKSFSTDIKVSKYSFLILLIALAIIIIALGNFLNSKYTVFFDHYGAASYTYDIGDSKNTKSSDAYEYHIFWSYISFGISSLCGIPPINSDALLFPFLYLFVTSVYLLIRALLIDLKESYALLSSIFVVTFSGLFYFFNAFNQPSFLLYSGMFFFSYKSFATFLFIISAALLIIVLKPSGELMKDITFIRKNLIIIMLSAFLLVNSYMLYPLLLLPAFSLFLLIILFYNEKKQSFLSFIVFLTFFTTYYIFFDILFDSFFSKSNKSLFYLSFDIEKTGNLSKLLFLEAPGFYGILIFTCFMGFFIYIVAIILTTEKGNIKGPTVLILYFMIINGLLIAFYFLFLYFFNLTPSSLISILFGLSFSQVTLIAINILLFLIISFSSLCFLVIFNIKYHGKKYFIKEKHGVGREYKKAKKAIFALILVIFSILFILNIFNTHFFIKDNFFYFYLAYIFLNIGFIGFLGICLMYFCYKENSRLFFILILWTISIIVVASILIFRAWNLYHNLRPKNIPYSLYDHMNIWFSRLWSFSIIPLSIFAALGLIKLKEFIDSKNFQIITNRNFKNILNLTTISILIVFTLSNTILSIVYEKYENEQGVYVQDDEAHIIGWIFENISPEDKFITDDYDLFKIMQEFPYYRLYYFSQDLRIIAKGQTLPYISYNYDVNCFLDYIEYLDGYYNILGFNDQNNKGLVSIRNDFEGFEQNGSIEFRIRTSDISKTFALNLSYAEPQLTAIKVMIRSNGFYGYNNTSLEKITDMLDNEWYKIIIYFECTNNGYKGLNKYHWRISINGTEYGDFQFMNNTDSINYFSFYSDKNYSNYMIYLNEVRYSWKPSKNDIIFDIQYALINWFEKRKIKYFFKYRDSKYYDELCENLNSEFNTFFLEIDDFLLTNLYKEEEYDYRYIEIYKL
jgi:hypothetical protein